MIKIIVVFLFLATTLHAGPVMASREGVDTETVEFPLQRGNLILRSTATATWMKFVDVYVAGLYAPGSSNPQQVLDGSKPLSLEIGYLVALDREKLVKAANIALARQHNEVKLSAHKQYINQLHDKYLGVKEGDRYRIDFRPGNGLKLILNDRQLAHINDDEFALLYLGIWLDEKPLSEPLRTALLDWSGS